MTAEPCPLEAIKTLLTDNWTAGNNDGITPTIAVMFDEPRRLDLSGGRDHIGIYLAGHATVPNALGGLAERITHRVSIDIRTVYWTPSISVRTHLRKLYNEVRRIVGSKLNEPDSDFNELMPLTYQDFSDRNKNFGRYVFDVQLKIMNLAR